MYHHRESRSDQIITPAHPLPPPPCSHPPAHLSPTHARHLIAARPHAIISLAIAPRASEASLLSALASRGYRATAKRASASRRGGHGRGDRRRHPQLELRLLGDHLTHRRRALAHLAEDSLEGGLRRLLLAQQLSRLLGRPREPPHRQGVVPGGGEQRLELRRPRLGALRGFLLLLGDCGCGGLRRAARVRERKGGKAMRGKSESRTASFSATSSADATRTFSSLSASISASRSIASCRSLLREACGLGVAFDWPAGAPAFDGGTDLRRTVGLGSGKAGGSMALD